MVDTPRRARILVLAKEGVSIMGKPRQYTREFKEEAVRLVESQDVSVRQVAGELGVSYWTLRYWLREAKDNGAEQPAALPLKEEVLQLRDENQRLRLEREILKKATAFFAKERE